MSLVIIPTCIFNLMLKLVVQVAIVSLGINTLHNMYVWYGICNLWTCNLDCSKMVCPACNTIDAGHAHAEM